MKTIRIFISSPGDVAEERDKAKQVIARLQTRYVGEAELLPILWEDLPLQADAPFQEGIEVVLAKNAGVDIAVFVLWSRLGSPLGGRVAKADGTTYRSGTEREFDLMLGARAAAAERGEPPRPAIIAYTREDDETWNKVLDPRAKSTDDLRALLEQRELARQFIRERFQDAEGHNLRAYHTYRNPPDFCGRLRTHLIALLDELVGPSQGGGSWVGSPYVGLSAFDFDQEPIFRGREREICELAERLRCRAAAGCAFVLVAGASGSGKSSLVRAGLLPALCLHELDDGVVQWRRAVLLPSLHGGNLLLALLRAVAGEHVLPELCEAAPAGLERLAADLRASPETIVANNIALAFQRAAEAAHGAVRLVLVVDQLEEIFTDGAIPAADRQAFFAALDALARSGNVWIVATLRSDYYALAQTDEALMRLRADAAGASGLFDLVAVDPGALQRVIVQPARMAGAGFETVTISHPEPLEQRILSDALKHPEALPHLQFLLQELYERRDRKTGLLTHQAYDDLGGVGGVLGRRAQLAFDTVAGRLGAKPVVDAFHALMRMLVTVQTEGRQRPVRRRAPLSLASAEPGEKALCEALIAARLLTADRGDGGEPVVAVGHEALFDSWPLLADWISDNRDFLKERARVESATQTWLDHGSQPGDLLPPGLPLERALDLLARHPREFGSEAAAFIRASAEVAETKRRQEIRRLRRRNFVYAGLAAVAAVAAILAGVQWREADANAKRADKESAEKQRNLEAASNADLASALKAWQEDFDAQQKSERAIGFHGRSRWHEAVALLVRSLERNPNNEYASFWLYNTLFYHGKDRRDWTMIECKHKAVVFTASFSPDGTRVVTASADKTARVWDATSGKAIGVPLRHRDWVTSASFSPDGTRVVTASHDGTARVWDVGSGNPVGKPMCHKDKVNIASFSPDGKRVVTASQDMTAQVWDATSGDPIGEAMQHENDVFDANFNPDGTHVVTASADKTARIWDATSGKAIGEPLCHENFVENTNFSPDGTRVVTASRDSTARVWDATSGNPVGEPMRHDGRVTSASFSPDGTRVVTASDDGTARVWNASSGQAIGAPLHHETSVVSAVFSPDGLYVVTASGDHTACVWDAVSGKTVGEPMRHEKFVMRARFSSDGARVVTASEDGTARVWDVISSNLIGESLRHNSEVYCASFSPDGSFIVTAGGDKIARVWDATSGKPVGEPLRHGSYVDGVSFSPDSTRVVTTSWDNTAQVWEASTGKPIGGPLRHNNRVCCSRFSPDGKWVVTASRDMTAQVWDATSGALIGEAMQHEGAVLDANFNPNGSRIVTASEDGTARVWNASSGEAVGESLLHGALVSSASFSPDGTRVVTASHNGTAQVWDVATSQSVGKPLCHGNWVNDAHFSPDGTRVVTAGEDGTARLWDTASGRAIGEPFHHEDGVMNASFSPDGMQVVTASRDMTARVWNMTNNKPAGEPLRHQNYVYSASFSPDGTRVVTASQDRTARVWNVATASPTINAAVLSWINGLIGVFYRSDGELVEMPWLMRLQVLSDTQDLPHEWQALAAWCTSPRPDQRLSVVSQFSLSQIAERERDFNGVGTVESLISALEYDYTLPLTRLLLANALEKASATKKSEEQDATIPDRAAFLRSYDLDRLPDDATLWFRAAKALNDAPDGAMVGIGSKAVTAQAAALPTAEKAVSLLKDNKPHLARMNLAHAYLFNGQFEKAKEIYAKYLGTAFDDGRKWNDEVRGDFKTLREAGRDHPDMKKIEALLNL